jgi:hypothetical protein
MKRVREQEHFSGGRRFAAENATNAKNPERIRFF